jgi:hypothetical protein
MRKLFVLAVSMVAVSALSLRADAQMANYSLANPVTAPSVVLNTPFGVASDQLGSFNATITGALVDLGADPFNFKSYCIDLAHDAAVGSQAVTLKDISLISNGNRAAWLYLNAVTTNEIDEAALQLAIWDVIYDNGDGLDFGNGDVSFIFASTPDDYVTKANAYVASSVGMSADAWWVSFNNHGDGTNQDIIAPKLSAPAVPEPGSIALLAGSAMGLGVVLRRRARK